VSDRALKALNFGVKSSCVTSLVCSAIYKGWYVTDRLLPAELLQSQILA
jgi:purine-cytosine permease-like protein